MLREPGREAEPARRLQAGTHGAGGRSGQGLASRAPVARLDLLKSDPPPCGLRLPRGRPPGAVTPLLIPSPAAGSLPPKVKEKVPPPPAPPRPETNPRRRHLPPARAPPSGGCGLRGEFCTSVSGRMGRRGPGSAGGGPAGWAGPARPGKAKVKVTSPRRDPGCEPAGDGGSAGADSSGLLAVPPRGRPGLALAGESCP